MLTVGITTMATVEASIHPSAGLERLTLEASCHSGEESQVCACFPKVTHLNGITPECKINREQAGRDPAAEGIPQQLHTIPKAAWAETQARQ